MIKIGEHVQLNDLEMKIAAYVGLHRYKINRRLGVPDLQVGDQPSEFTDINGAAGEIAFAKIFNLYPDLQFENRPHYDFIWCGYTVDVKTTHHPKGRITATAKCKAKACNLYAQMTGEYTKSGIYIYHGMCTGKQLFQDENIKDLGHGPGYCFEQFRLRHPKLGG